jgi:hypothetical protein
MQILANEMHDIDNIGIKLLGERSKEDGDSTKISKKYFIMSS